MKKCDHRRAQSFKKHTLGSMFATCVINVALVRNVRVHYNPVVITQEQQYKTPSRPANPD